jgi:hypothetical protein
VSSLHEMLSDSSVVVVVPTDVHPPCDIVIDDLSQLVITQLIRSSGSLQLKDEISFAFAHSNVSQVLIPLHVAQEGGSFLLLTRHPDFRICIRG